MIESADIPQERDVDLVALDDALISLAAIDPRQSQIVELRFFGGLTIEETAEVLGVSLATVKREWNVAKLWLLREMKKSGT
jgi:RNA polymerase sigma factor (TIGR02999 family)